MTIISAAMPRDAIRLYLGDDDDASEMASTTLSEFTTLTQFFSTWYRPVELESHGVSASTIELYLDSLGWWSRITGDPPLRATDEYTIAKFQTGLRDAQYRRGPGGMPRSLSPWTQAKHLKNVRTILRRTGPTINPEKPGKGLVACVPPIRIKALRGKPKPCFALATARRIASAATDLPGDVVPGISAARWWRGLFAALFFSGLRIGTVLQLEWSMLVERDGFPILSVPGRIVDKTDKSIDVAVHDQLASHLALLRGLGGGVGRIFSWPHHYTHLCNVHSRLQLAAGVPTVLSPQAWRRTHGTEMARLGAAHAIEIARQSLDHGDAKTTTGFYVDVLGELIRKLPELVPAVESSERQGRLF